jgi:hypothetical protein
MCGRTKLCVMTARDVSQNQNKKGSYDELLAQIKSEHETKAKALIPELCYLLRKEDPWLSNDDIKDRVKKDLVDIWSPTTISKYIPDEFKNKKHQETGRMKGKSVSESIPKALKVNVLGDSTSTNTDGDTQTVVESSHHNEIQKENEDLKKQIKELEGQVRRDVYNKNRFRFHCVNYRVKKIIAVDD